MTTLRADVEQAIRSFLIRVDKPRDEIGPDTALFADGLGLDSLETAELSAVLEDDFGRDPFQGERMPQTVGDILDYYGHAVASA